MTDRILDSVHIPGTAWAAFCKRIGLPTDALLFDVQQKFDQLRNVDPNDIHDAGNVIDDLEDKTDELREEILRLKTELAIAKEGEEKQRLLAEHYKSRASVRYEQEYTWIKAFEKAISVLDGEGFDSDVLVMVDLLHWLKGDTWNAHNH